MSSVVAGSAAGLPASSPDEQKPPPSLKPCCACPETKQARDAWTSARKRRSREYCGTNEANGEIPISIIEKGEEHCGPLIEAHKECMRALGFKI